VLNGLRVGQPFVVGTLTHFNCPINGPHVSLAELRIPLKFLGGPVIENAARFDLEIHETSNDGVCPYPSESPCADRLRWTSNSTIDSFFLNEQRYSISLRGFSLSSDPQVFAPVAEFISEERRSNVAFLIAVLLQGPVCAAGYDVCNVCGGDGTSCSPRGCDDAIGSSAAFDVCGVCGGDGQSCRDCRGVANGSARYDACGVCNGNGSTCRDCSGAINGRARYDVCDVCNGDGRSCRDCAGVPNGPAGYDICGVCNGDNRSCLDCRGVTRGTVRYDRCGVCGGDGRSCLDCRGVAFGTNRYDSCDVCGGDGSSCRDCAGIANGSAR
jgi:hypothetical protein